MKFFKPCRYIYSIFRLFLFIILLGIFLIFWHMFVYLLDIPNYLFPSPLDIIIYTISHFNILLINSSISFFEALGGLFLAFIFSIVFGIIAIYTPLIINFVYKILLVIQIIPLIAIAPLIVIWIGFGITAKILIVFTICLFPCLISFLRGSMNIDKELILLVKSMGSTQWQIFKLIVLPNSMYSLFSGLKIAATYSVTGAVIAEYLGAEKGIGVYLARAISSFDSDALFANIFFLIISTLLIYKLITYLEIYIIHSKRQSN